MILKIILHDSQRLRLKRERHRIVHSYETADFLRDRIWAYCQDVIANLRSYHPTAVFECLWPLDANQGAPKPSGKFRALNFYVNLPNEWKNSSYGIKDFRCVTIAAASGSATHNLLSTTHPDTLAASPVLGDLIAANATPAWSRVAGNTAAPPPAGDGNGSAAALPAWDTLVSGDLPAHTHAGTDITSACHPKDRRSRWDAARPELRLRARTSRSP